MNGPHGSFALLLLSASCVGTSQAQTAVEGSAATREKGWDVSKVGNLSRVPGLKSAHKDVLARQGFFLAPQEPPPRTVKPVLAQRDRTQATHLFHVYERNDYLRFPSFITVDLAIDTTHAYFDALLRDLEQYQLGPMLARALTEMLKEAEQVRATASTEAGRAVARRNALFWAVSLRLVKNKAPLPAALREDTDKLVNAIVACDEHLPIEVTRAPFDVTQTKPRGHYTRSRDLERFFRSMSWLGMAAFYVEGELADVEGAALLARTWLGSKAGREGLERLMKVTTFFVGGADSAGLAEAATALRRVSPAAAGATADQLVVADVQARLQKELVATLAAPRIGPAVRQLRVLGRRAFEDAVAMQELLPVLPGVVADQGVARAIPPLFGARAAAAVMGSPVARDAILAAMAASARVAVAAKLERGRTMVSAIPPERWSQDAYHGTLFALRPLLEPSAGQVPPLLATDAWRLRALQAFASGWAELRHDTILYGEQLGAECDVEDLGPPPCWVEPVPELYRRLAGMIRELTSRLKDAGVNIGLSPKLRAGTSPDEPEPLTIMAQPPAEKSKMLISFLDELAAISEAELRGKELDTQRLTWLTTVGGLVEWMLMTFANSETLNDRDADMAVIADVFTWRPAAQVLEVGVARPELIYAIIPSPKGPVLARGAVMSYRELMQPQASRMTDDGWRAEIAAGRTPARPDWLAPVYAEAPGPVKPPKVTQDRCGPMSGALIKGL